MRSKAVAQAVYRWLLDYLISETEGGLREPELEILRAFDKRFGLIDGTDQALEVPDLSPLLTQTFPCLVCKSPVSQPDTYCKMCYFAEGICRCECGASKVKDAVHADWCPERKL